VNDEGLQQAVDALGAAFRAGDSEAALDQFATRGPVVYAGSEPDEVAVGRDAVRALLFTRDERYSWRTVECHAASSGKLAYVVADVLLLVHPVESSSRTDVICEEVPYRLSGVLERVSNGWRWRLCAGSEPVDSTIS
jgi:hypothetical protein